MDPAVAGLGAATGMGGAWDAMNAIRAAISITGTVAILLDVESWKCCTK